MFLISILNGKPSTRLSEWVSSRPPMRMVKLDLVAFNLDADGFGDIAKDLALSGRAAGVLFHLIEEQVLIEFVRVEEPVADIHFRQRMAALRRSG